MQGEIDHNERLCRLRLARSRGVGPLTYRQLLQRFGSAKAAIGAIVDGEVRAKGRTIGLLPADIAAQEHAAIKKSDGQLITFGEAAYPEPLAAIPDPPPILTLRGDRGLITKPMIAIVGARNASAAGRSFARSLARDLGDEGYVVVSGLARGMDGAAHEGALETGTVAVLAGGADNVYPPEHTRLYADIVRQGAVLSEQPLGMVARARDFPKRNRIVSGLSLGVVVVEAAERSGTLITARLASEQGRDVFAVPGSPMDPRCAGTNQLLRRGAILLRDAQDVVTELANTRSSLFEPEGLDWHMDDEATDEAPQGLKEELLGLLSYTPIHRDALIAEAKAPAAVVAMALLDLVLEGRITEENGGGYTLAEPSSETAEVFGT
ncbi:MAG: DNA-processing protein DprA [Pseudomonadota bacterium]